MCTRSVELLYAYCRRAEGENQGFDPPGRDGCALRLLRRFFSIYAPDYWIYLVLSAALTAAALYVNKQGGSPSYQSTLCLFAFLNISCVTLTQTHRRFQASPLTWLSTKAGARFSASFTPIQLNNYRAHILILAALSFVYAVRTIGRILTGTQPLVLVVYLLFFGLILLALFIGIRRSFAEPFARMLIAASMLFPIVIDIFLEGGSNGHTPVAYVWLIVSVVFSMFTLNRGTAGLFFKLFACLLFAGMICEMAFSPGLDVMKTADITANVFSSGFVIFAALEFYTAHSARNYQVLEDIYRELKETQDQLVQREQMVTLGHLIAGVAHEINTPIGAIKASAEMLETYDLGRMFRVIRHLNDEDTDAVLSILRLCARSIKAMRSTVEIRRGKAQVRTYLESVGIAAADRIAAALSGMEICDIEKVADHLDLFRRENIWELLKAARDLSAYITGVQSIRFASENVTKIIFALKSFSRMNISGEEREFDVIQSIDNVLVLYQNQLKRGVEIVKNYDEDCPKVYGNMEEIRQVWTNIAQNAIHAMSYVGKLTIDVKNLIDTVEVSFTDTGSGIPPESIEKIFAPFFTTKPLGEGSGLGLDICSKIIQRHGGDISVESRPGQGATFTVTLPVRHKAG